MAFDSLRRKYTEQVKYLGQTGFGLTIEQLEMSAYSTILSKYVLLCIYAQPVEYKDGLPVVPRPSRMVEGQSRAQQDISHGAPRTNIFRSGGSVIWLAGKHSYPPG
jgi:hypothetical protein